MTVGKYRLRIEYKAKVKTVDVAAHDELEVFKILGERFPGYRLIVPDEVIENHYAR